MYQGVCVGGCVRVCVCVCVCVCLLKKLRLDSVLGNHDNMMYCAVWEDPGMLCKYNGHRQVDGNRPVFTSPMI